MVGYELLAEPQRDLTPEEAAERLGTRCTRRGPEPPGPRRAAAVVHRARVRWRRPGRRAARGGAQCGCGAAGSTTSRTRGWRTSRARSRSTRSSRSTTSRARSRTSAASAGPACSPTTRCATLERGLAALRRDVEAGRVAWDPSLEDVHLNLETLLTERVGAVGGKLHTGRSRNDQVATDLRLWTRRAVDRLDAGLVGLERALVDLAEREGDAVLPGTTHIQPAQPVLLAHHLLAYVEMLERDRGRLADARRRANVSPLGAGALAGAGYPLDRETTAAELGFDGRHGELARRGLGPRLRRRARRRGGPRDGPPLAGWPRSSPGGRTRGSGSCGSPTRSRPGPR